MYKKTCAFCGVAFTTRYEAQKYCSPDCKQKSRNTRERSKKATTKKCAQCGKLFTPRKITGRYCSERCAKRARYLLNKEKILAVARALRASQASAVKMYNELKMSDPYAGRALYFDGLHREGRTLACRRPDFALGF